VISPVAWPGLYGAEHRRFRLAIIGDVRIEFRTSLPGQRFVDITRDSLVYAPFRVLVSGTAVNLASRAIEYFQQVRVFAKIGNDSFTPIIREHVRKLGVGGRLVVAEDLPNGFTAMLHENPENTRPEEATRLLIASQPAPSWALSSEDVHTFLPDLCDADMLFVDGYSLLSSSCRSALADATRHARSIGIKIAVDLVPHDIDRRLALSDLMSILAAADLIVTEAGTVARLVERPNARDRMAELLPALDEAVPGRPLWLLRHGAGSMEKVLAYQHGGVLLHYQTGCSAWPESTGFGDRITACELYWWLSVACG